MTATVCDCGKPVNGAYLCGDCTVELRKHLADVPGVRRELEVSLSRQSAVERQEGGRSHEKPLPYDLGASVALEALGKALRRWTGLLGFLTADIDGCSALLTNRLGVLRQREDAGACLAEVGQAVIHGRQIVDRRADRWYVGPCNGEGWTDRDIGVDEHGCGFELYARPGAVEVACRRCGISYDVAQRRAWMLEAAEDYLLPLPEMGRALSGLLGTDLKAGTMGSWKSRGQLVPHGREMRGGRSVELFRVGDVIDLVARLQDPNRRGRRADGARPA